MIKSRRGMTLIEVTITLVVAGLMALAGTEAFRTIIDHRRIIMTASSATERAAALREQLHAWLTSGKITAPAAAIRAAGAAGQAIQIMAFGANGQLQNSVTPAVVSGDDINFVTTAPNPAQSDSCIMRLFIDDDQSTPEWGLTMEYKVSVSSPLIRVQLDTMITSLTADYLDTQSGQWYATSDAATITPKAVRITFGDSLGTGILQLPIVIPMVAPAAAGAVAGGAGG